MLIDTELILYNIFKMVILENHEQKKYLNLEEAVKKYSVSESTIRYAHELCPEQKLIVMQQTELVDPSKIGLTIAYSDELLGEIGFDFSPRFQANFQGMLNNNRVPLEVNTDKLMIAQLKKYWSLCLEHLDKYTSKRIKGKVLDNDNIDYSKNKNSNKTFNVIDIKKTLGKNFGILNNIVSLYHKYVKYDEENADLWASYKANLSIKLEDRLFKMHESGFYNPCMNLNDMRFALRAGIIIFNPDKLPLGFHLHTYALIKQVQEISSKHRAELHEEPGDTCREHALDLCRMAYKAEGVNFTGEFHRDEHSLNKALKKLSRAEHNYYIVGYYEGLSFEELEMLYALPESLLQIIHTALLQKIRFKLAK